MLAHAAVNGRVGTSIDVEGVSKRFNETIALSKTDLSLGQGEFVVLLGPSGCGKTTLLRMIAGLEPVTTGEIRIGGAPLWRSGRRNDAAVSSMAVVFQEANLLPWLNIADNVALPLKLRGVGKKQRRERAYELCKLVGIAGFESHLPRQLSGGMRQRASIARALSYDPDVLLMDEPFGALDAITRDAMNVELQRIWRETSKTVVFVTHSIPEAVFLADRIVVLTARPGRVASIQPVEFERPRSPDVQSKPEFQQLVDQLRVQLEER